MVEIFKTNIQELYQAQKLSEVLSTFFPECKINFDLEDVDKVLRIEGTEILSTKIIELVNAKGYYCELLN